MSRNLFLYWTGKKYSLIKIFHKIVYLHSNIGKGYNIILITPENVHNYVSLPPFFYDLLPAHQADYVRVNVVCDHGGIWLDSDILIVDKLDYFFDILETIDGFFVKENNQQLFNGFFGSKPNTPIMVGWKKLINETLNKKNEKIKWNEIGSHILYVFEHKYPHLYQNYIKFDGLDNIYPINWNRCVNEYIIKPYENYEKIERVFQPVLILVNSVYKFLEHMKEREILSSNTPLNYFINKSFENIKYNNLVSVHQNNTNNLNFKKYVLITDWLETYITKEHFIFAKNLEQFGWNFMYLSDLNVEKMKDEKCIILCVTYDDLDVSLLKSENTKIIYKIDDLYPWTQIRQKNCNVSDYVIGPYQYLFPNNLKNTFWVPYSAIEDFYQKTQFNENPKKKIFVSGRIDNCYPLRKYISSNEKFKDYIETLDHPQYKNYTHDIIDEKYYKMLNNYVCCFTDCSSYNYVLLKIFEITSVGSLLLVEDKISEQLNKLGFYDGINCVMCNEENIYEKIVWITDPLNEQEVNNIRFYGMIVTRSIHNTFSRSKSVDTYVNEIFRTDASVQNINTLTNTRDNIIQIPEIIKNDEVVHNLDKSKMNRK